MRDYDNDLRIAYYKLKDFVERINYKPGFQLRVATPLTEDLRMRYYSVGVEVVMRVPNTRSERRELVTVMSTARIEVDFILNVEDEVLAQRIFHEIQELEIHECAEWFTLDGRMIFYPHLKD